MRSFLLLSAALVLATLPGEVTAGGCTCACPSGAGCNRGCKVCERVARYCDCVGGCNLGSCASGYSEISQWHSGCFPGFAKEHCRRNCGTYTMGVCTECASGYYGSKCQYSCKCVGTSVGYSTCRDGLTGTGQCICGNNRYGQYCQYEKLDCEYGTTEMYSNPAVCECYHGWEGTLCNERITDAPTPQPTQPTYAPTKQPTDVASSAVIQVVILTLTGKRITINTDQSDTVAELKAAIATAEGIDADQQRLIFSGALMEDVNTLQSYNVKDGSTIHLVIRLRG